MQKRILGSILLMFAIVIAGCDAEQFAEFLQDAQTPPSVGGRPDTSQPTATAARDEDSITIASFNIQVFGQSKLKKPAAMDVLAKVVRRFDVVAIQEIRSKKDDVMPRFVKLINSDGSRYDFVIGERLGRTSSKEQYAFVFDTTRIQAVPMSTYTVPDPGDHLHREPLAASFRVVGRPTGEAFTFTLVNIHTDPDETKTELNALDDAFVYVKTQNPAEDDVIILGDLNVDADHLGQLGQLPNITWVVPATTMTNTRGSKSYDNIVFDKSATVEYTGSGGVLNLLTEFDLTKDEALKVSDHLPVWATFTASEGGKTPHIATRPNQGR